MKPDKKALHHKLRNQKWCRKELKILLPIWRLLEKYVQKTLIKANAR